MAYANADELLPPELLREVQKYIQGCLLYVPRSGPERLGWGSRSGARAALDSRNDAIRSGKASGLSIDELAEAHGLSPDAIRKILYCRRREQAS